MRHQSCGEGHFAVHSPSIHREAALRVPNPRYWQKEVPLEVLCCGVVCPAFTHRTKHASMPERLFLCMTYIGGGELYTIMEMYVEFRKVARGWQHEYDVPCGGMLQYCNKALQREWQGQSVQCEVGIKIKPASIYLSACLPLCPSGCLPACLLVGRLVRPSVRQSVCLPGIRHTQSGVPEPWAKFYAAEVALGKPYMAF